MITVSKRSNVSTSACGSYTAGGHTVEFGNKSINHKKPGGSFTQAFNISKWYKNLTSVVEGAVTIPARSSVSLASNVPTKLIIIHRPGATKSLYLLNSGPSLFLNLDLEFKITAAAYTSNTFEADYNLSVSTNYSKTVNLTWGSILGFEVSNVVLSTWATIDSYTWDNIDDELTRSNLLVSMSEVGKLTFQKESDDTFDNQYVLTLSDAKGQKVEVVMTMSGTIGSSYQVTVESAKIVGKHDATLSLVSYVAADNSADAMDLSTSLTFTDINTVISSVTVGSLTVLESVDGFALDDPAVYNPHDEEQTLTYLTGY